MSAGSVFGIAVARGGRPQVVEQILRRAREARPGYVVFADTNVMMEAAGEPSFHGIVRDAALVVADGAPVWLEARRGASDVERHPGPDVVPQLLGEAERAQVPVGFLGLDADRLERLRGRLRERWPRLRIVLARDPGVGPPEVLVTDRLRQEIRASGARLLFVGLGCPKQEQVMDLLSPLPECLMLGVGQALDLIAGSTSRAPLWMRRAGLEWSYRLLRQPRRLGSRYLRAARFPFAVIAWNRREDRR